MAVVNVSLLGLATATFVQVGPDLDWRRQKIAQLKEELAAMDAKNEQLALRTRQAVSMLREVWVVGVLLVLVLLLLLLLLLLLVFPRSCSVEGRVCWCVRACRSCRSCAPACQLIVGLLCVKDFLSED